MSDCVEVLFVSDNNDKAQNISCFNPHIGTTLMTYRGCGASAKNCLSLIRNDYLLSAETDKPILHFWPLNSQEQSSDLKTVTTGKLSALSVSPDGYYCVGGISGKVFIWQTSSGCLLNVITKHYQAINKIVFTDDSSHFITAGEDALILVWRLADAVSKQCGSMFDIPRTAAAPVYTFTEHSLPVVDIFVGHGNLKARLFSVSVDQTCKIFCLSTGTLLLSLLFNNVLTSVTVNNLETALFLGTKVGKINALDLDPYPRSLVHIVSDDSDALSTFSGHTEAVTCLSASLDGLTLASGSSDSKVFLWNIPGKQLLRSFNMKGPVTNLFFSIASENIFASKLCPSVAVSRFEKVGSLDEKDLELNVWVHKRLKPISFDSPFETEQKEQERFERKEEGDDGGDVDSLKQQIMKLKEVNKQLYQFAMKKILKNPVSIGSEEKN